MVVKPLFFMIIKLFLKNCKMPQEAKIRKPGKEGKRKKVQGIFYALNVWTSLAKSKYLLFFKSHTFTGEAQSPAWIIW